jgi:thiamine-monophosphate kinase
MEKLKDIGEHGFIRALRKRFPMTLAGDDAAVLSSLRTPVVTTDSFFQGTHFHLWWATPDRLAARLLEAALSDIAAMGAEPRCVLSSVMLPPDIEVSWLMDFYKGLTSRNDCPVAGGETIKGPLFGVTLTAVGDCGTKEPFRRSLVAPGDSIWVTGPLGRSLHSPGLLEKGREQELSDSEQKQIELFLSPQARFDVLDDLRRVGVKAAIDVSDGLFSECSHLARESGVHVKVEMESVPLVPFAKIDPLGACAAGEDFELLFALSERAPSPGKGFYKVGTASKGEGFSVTKNGEPVNTQSEGYDHFS